MAASNKPWETDYRIPQDTQPLHYDLYLFPDLSLDTFEGHVSINIECRKPRDFFLVHVKYLNVTGTQVTTVDDGTVVPLSEAFEYKDNEFWVVKLLDFVPKGNYTLKLAFEGRLDNGILGFYRSIYKDGQGNQHKMATSKFQPTYARRAFPCFDEPSFKSTFKTTLVKPNTDGYIALSNMPEESSQRDQPRQGFTEVTFQVSAPMVTYLAIFIVCDFEYIEKVSAVHKRPLKVYGTAQQKKHLNYALDIGSAIADYYETYFDVPYPLPKLDMAAIPDYSSGATEHWGLITYRETNLIYDPQESSSANKVRVAEVIAHELAHQWFGNLMTVSWWNDLWLNEGFATYIEYKGVKSYETDWDMESRFLTSDLHRVLKLDSTFSSHPIVVDVDTPDQINAVFDTISYSKGASVIRMMESFMGEGDFRKGIHNFLVNYSFKNAVTQDLLDELSAVSSDKLDVTAIMNTWTRQKGYPVLTLEKMDNTYRIGQERFLSDKESYNKTDEQSPFAYKWEIPVTFIADNNNETRQVWMHTTDSHIAVPVPSGAKWVKFNVGQFGYYRVNYPLDDWSTFSSVLLDDVDALSISDRTSLLNDAFALASGDRLPYGYALGLTSYLATREKAVSPWETAFDALDSLAKVLYYTPTYYPLSQYVRKLTDTLYQQLGWTEGQNETNEMLQLRTLILAKACEYGHAECLEEAGKKLLAYKNGEKISPNLRNVVYVNGMKEQSNMGVWEWMWQLYLNEENAQEKLKLLRGLASIQEPWILYKLMDLAKDETKIRSQDYFTLLTYVSWNRVGEPLVWDFVRNEWEYLVQRFTLNDRLLGRLMQTITEKFATETKLEEMRAFYAKYPDAGAGANYRKIALETVQNNINFVNSKAAQDVHEWLQQQH